MGDVLVRKSIMNVISSRGPEIMYNLDQSSEVPYLPGQSQMSQMTQTPEDAYGKFQYQAPKLDDAGSRRLADIYGTTGMNQRIGLAEKVRDAAPDSEEGFRNAMAQQKVFETAGQAGETAHRRRDADANALGFLAGVIGLANAGAAGQDAFSGALGAAGQYQATSQQVQGTSRRAGERAARRAANKVGVTQPQVAEPTPTPQVAEPTPRRQIMVTGVDGEPTPYVGQGGRDSAAARTHTPSPGAQALGYYGTEAEGKLRDTQRQATDLIGVTGNPLQMPLSQMRGDGTFRVMDDAGNEIPKPPVAVAPPTTQTPQTPEQIGETIAANTIDNTEEEELDNNAAQTIQDNINAAKQQSGQKQSMTRQTQLPKDTKNASFNPMRFIGVV